ncbi:unnamed protein product [Closterium sp. NIES-64]|nr:unnamed protein product [Closterium sp. NIES-64]
MLLFNWTRPLRLLFNWTRPLRLLFNWTHPLRLLFNWTRPLRLLFNWTRPLRLLFNWTRPLRLLFNTKSRDVGIIGAEQGCGEEGIALSMERQLGNTNKTHLCVTHLLSLCRLKTHVDRPPLWTGPPCGQAPLVDRLPLWTGSPCGQAPLPFPVERVRDREGEVKDPDEQLLKLQQKVMHEEDRLHAAKQQHALKHPLDLHPFSPIPNPSP